MFRPGQFVLGYEVVRKLGEGSFGAVHLARSADGALVAIKTLVAAAADHGSRFRREAAGLRRVNSENVAKIVDYTESEEFGRVLVMEYIPGELLSSALELSVFSVPESVELGLGLARGLADMHVQGVVHRDIKPSNIMLRTTSDGGHMPVIFDLGLARLLDGPGAALDPRAEHTSTGGLVAIGTPAYMAPEQILDAARALPSADVYGVGVCLYRTALGRLPFEGDDRDIARRKLTEEPPPLKLPRQDEFGLRYAAVVNRCLARRAAERFRDGAELAEALQELSQLVAHVPKAGRITSGTLARVEFPARRPPPSSGTLAPGSSLAFRSQKSRPRALSSTPASTFGAVRKTWWQEAVGSRVLLIAVALVALVLGVWLGLH